MKLLVIALFVVFGSCNALKCFDCMDCKEKVGNVRECTSSGFSTIIDDDDDDVCMKVILGTHIVKRCGKQSLCGLGRTERTASRIWNSIANAFRDVDQDTALVYCCDDDYCNSAFKTLPSISIILLPLLLVSLFKY